MTQARTVSEIASEILEKMDRLHKIYVEGDQPRKWVPDPEIDYRDGEMCSVCGASDIARAYDDVEDSYCTSCAVNSMDAFEAAAASAYPALREEIERLRGALASRELEWSPFSDAPQDGRKLIVGSIAKFTPYKEPKKQGRKGRWQVRDEYGKWRNIDRTADHFIAGYKPDRRTLKGDEDNG